MKKTLSAAFLLSVISACAGVSEKSQAVGPKGSVLSISEGLTLTVPAGALPKDTVLTVRDTSFGPGEHELEFEPKGLALSAPVALTLTDDDGVSMESETELELERAEDHSDLRFSTLGHVSIRKIEDRPHTRRSCKWVLVSYDPVTATSVYVCSYARP